jgi:hypothetical protein
MFFEKREVWILKDNDAQKHRLLVTGYRQP